jgi:hypothetical protein
VFKGEKLFVLPNASKLDVSALEAQEIRLLLDKMKQSWETGNRSSGAGSRLV